MTAGGAVVIEYGYHTAFRGRSEGPPCKSRAVAAKYLTCPTNSPARARAVPRARKSSRCPAQPPAAPLPTRIMRDVFVREETRRAGRRGRQEGALPEVQQGTQRARAGQGAVAAKAPAGAGDCAHAAPGIVPGGPDPRRASSLRLRLKRGARIRRRGAASGAEQAGDLCPRIRRAALRRSTNTASATPSARTARPTWRTARSSASSAARPWRPARKSSRCAKPGVKKKFAFAICSTWTPRPEEGHQIRHCAGPDRPGPGLVGQQAARHEPGGDEEASPGADAAGPAAPWRTGRRSGRRRARPRVSVMSAFAGGYVAGQIALRPSIPPRTPSRRPTRAARPRPCPAGRGRASRRCPRISRCPRCAPT